MSEPRYIDIFIDPNPNTPEGCGQRFKAESEPRSVSRVRYFVAPDRPLVCQVSGWFAAGGVGMACPAQAVSVEDSGSGAAMLVFGGDWGLRLTPQDGTPPFGEPYLLIAAEDILE